MRTTWTQGILSGLLASVVLCCGCGGEDIGLVPAHGTIKLDGQPLPDAQVVFKNEKGDVYGRTDSSGEYQLEYSNSKVGAFPGENVVSVSTRVVWDDGASDERADDPDLSKIAEKVPAKYNLQSELKVDVQGGKEPYDFDLTTN